MLRRLYKIAKSFFSDDSKSNDVHRQFRFENLESKDMLTGMINFDNVTGVITIQGDGSNDNALVYENGNRVIASLGSS